jgi:hypothetical protein
MCQGNLLILSSVWKSKLICSHTIRVCGRSQMSKLHFVSVYLVFSVSIDNTVLFVGDAVEHWLLHSVQ